MTKWLISDSFLPWPVFCALISEGVVMDGWIEKPGGLLEKKHIEIERRLKK